MNAMSVKDFDRMKQRDFSNGAALDEIHEALTQREELLAACETALAFVGVMFGKGEDADIPETVVTPLGIPVKLGDISRAMQDALSKAKAQP